MPDFKMFTRCQPDILTVLLSEILKRVKALEATTATEELENLSPC